MPREAHHVDCDFKRQRSGRLGNTGTIACLIFLLSGLQYSSLLGQKHTTRATSDEIEAIFSGNGTIADSKQKDRAAITYNTTIASFYIGNVTNIDSVDSALVSNPGKPICTEVNGTQVDTTDPSLPPYFLPVNVLVKGLDALENASTIYAVCRWMHCPMHHPHFMQEITRCFSFWRSRPHQRPVLYAPRRQFYRYFCKMRAFRKRFPFSAGLLQGLIQSFNLLVVKETQEPSVTTQKFDEEKTVSPFAMASKDDALALRKIFIPNETPRNVDGPLRIAIYNRNKENGRSIMNIGAVYRTVQHAFPNDTVSLVTVWNNTSFDFEKEIQFFNSQDVIVSPHGHQLTGIMFMSPCSAVLELFPYLYYTPNFFQSMSNLMDIIHIEWYVADTGEVFKGILDLETRLNNTRNQLCPAVAGVVLAVQKLVERRRLCLQSRSFT